MPELPEMQALGERLQRALGTKVLVEFALLGFSALKTVLPPPKDLVGQALQEVRRRGKFLVLEWTSGAALLVHLSQAGRLDLERPSKATKPRGSLARLVFDDGTGVLVREHGTQRKAGLWVLAPGDEGPLATLGPEPFDEAFEAVVMGSESPRQLHTILRDQRVVAGIGRGYADDALNRAGLSPFASLRSLDACQRRRLLRSVRSVLAEALERERTREGGLSEPRLGARFAVHNRGGSPCPACGRTLERVSFDSREVVYCPACQTKGRVLADRRLSRLLR